MCGKESRPRWYILPGALLSLALVSYLDYATGDELLFFVFYFYPVCLAAWFWGRTATLLMATASAFSWYLVDRLSAHTYSHEGFRYGNAFICFIAFALIGVVLHRLRQALLALQRSQQELGKALAELEESTKEIRTLQSHLQVICAWTKRIRVDDSWIPLERFLSEKLKLSLSHGISPEALDEAKSFLDRQEPPETKGPGDKTP